MSETWRQRDARWDREAQTRALQEQAAAAKRQTELLQQQNWTMDQEARRQRREARRQNGKGSFHGLYCLLVGWWLAMFLICCIVPLFFEGGRSLIKKAFGIW